MCIYKSNNMGKRGKLDLQVGGSNLILISLCSESLKNICTFCFLRGRGGGLFDSESLELENPSRHFSPKKGGKECFIYYI